MNEELKKIGGYNNQPNNLFSLLAKYRVIIPGIQRHYVQGTDDVHAKEVREIFISDIFKHIEDKEELCLDFIYGPIDTEGNDSFIPVDGQQRLTTLWLMARFFAEYVEDESRKSILKLLGRFSYEGRIHATRFCNELVNEKNGYGTEKRPSEAIAASEWFNPYWKHGITISAMLNMLDTIHNRFNGNKEDMSKRAADCLVFIHEKIRFHLCVDQFADDIYMKMNARGLTLTQWENFKGKFSSIIGKENGEEWDRKIEDLSDNYFTISKELPDDSFLALIARILVFYIPKTQPDKKEFSNLQKLADCKWTEAGKAELPYVPFDEFKNAYSNLLNKADLVNGILLIIEKLTTEQFANLPSPYWESGRKLWQSVFKPKNKNESDLSLVLFEYFLKNTKVSLEDFELSLRLIWNVLENVSNERVEVLKKLIESSTPNLYSQVELLQGFEDTQYKEEFAKAQIYNKKENIELLQSCEKHMNGRVRLGVLDLNRDAIEIDYERLKVLKLLFELYKETPDNCEDNRKRMILMVIAAEDVRPKDMIPLEAKPDSLRALFSNRNDKALQKNLIDFLKGKSKEELLTLTPEKIWENNKENNPTGESKEPWFRDWRETIINLAEMKSEFLWGRCVRWHNTNWYYLYSGSTIKGALPINDYRIALWDNEEYKRLGTSFNSVEMNDCETRSGLSKDGNIFIYFFKDHCRLRKKDGEAWKDYEEIKMSDMSGDDKIGDFIKEIMNKTASPLFKQ